MKKLFLSLCFMGLATFAFANTDNNNDKPKNNTHDKEKNVVIIKNNENDNSIANEPCTIHVTQVMNEITITISVTAETCRSAIVQAYLEMEAIAADFK